MNKKVKVAQIRVDSEIYYDFLEECYKIRKSIDDRIYKEKKIIRKEINKKAKVAQIRISSNVYTHFMELANKLREDLNIKQFKLKNGIKD